MKQITYVPGCASLIRLDDGTKLLVELSERDRKVQLSRVGRFGRSEEPLWEFQFAFPVKEGSEPARMALGQILASLQASQVECSGDLTSVGEQLDRHLENRLQADSRDEQPMQQTRQEQVIVELLRQHVKSAQGLHIHPDIPTKKLGNAIQAYAQLRAGETALCLVDTSVFGSARTGILLSDLGIHWSDKSAARFLEYSEIPEVSHDSSFTHRCLMLADGTEILASGDASIPGSLANFLNAARMSVQQVWYLGSEEKRQGPLSTVQIRNMLARGEIDPSTCVVWKEGMVGALPVADLPELAAGWAPPSTTPAPTGAPAKPTVRAKPAEQEPFELPSTFDLEPCARQGEAFIVVCGSCETPNQLPIAEVEQATEGDSTVVLQPTGQNVQSPEKGGGALVFVIAGLPALLLGSYIGSGLLKVPFVWIIATALLYGLFKPMVSALLAPFVAKERPVYSLGCGACGVRLAITSDGQSAHRLKIGADEQPAPSSANNT